MNKRKSSSRKVGEKEGGLLFRTLGNSQLFANPGSLDARTSGGLSMVITHHLRMH